MNERISYHRTIDQTLLTTSTSQKLEQLSELVNLTALCLSHTKAEYSNPTINRVKFMYNDIFINALSIYDKHTSIITKHHKVLLEKLKGVKVNIYENKVEYVKQFIDSLQRLLSNINRHVLINSSFRAIDSCTINNGKCDVFTPEDQTYLDQLYENFYIEFNTELSNVLVILHKQIEELFASNIITVEKNDSIFAAAMKQSAYFTYQKEINKYVYVNEDAHLMYTLYTEIDECGENIIFSLMNMDDDATIDIKLSMVWIYNGFITGTIPNIIEKINCLDSFRMYVNLMQESRLKDTLIQYI